MKIQVIYSSLSGSTKKLAEGIYNNLEYSDKSIHDLKDGEPPVDADIVLLGYWVDKGGPNPEMIKFMEKLEHKVVGVFCTLAYFVDSSHANGSLQKGIDLVKDKNTVLGSIVCNGKLSDAMIARFKQAPVGTPHSATPENILRWAIMEDHPTQAEIVLGAERFNERIKLYRKCTEQNLQYKSLV